MECHHHSQEWDYDHEEIWERKRTLKYSSTLLKSFRFYFHLLITLISLFIFIKMSLMNYWPTFCKTNHWALYAFVGGLYTLTIFSTCSLISWIFLQDCSWYLTSSLFFITSLVLILGGLAYFVDYTVPATICSFCDKIEENGMVMEITSVRPATEETQLKKEGQSNQKVRRFHLLDDYEKAIVAVAREKRKSLEEWGHKKATCRKNYDSFSVWTVILVGISCGLGLMGICMAIAICFNAILHRGH